MSKSKHKKSSKIWLDEHNKDYYVIQSKKQGLRSRASYKLIELQEKYKLFKNGMNIVELGSSPGGWSQVLTNFVGDQGKIFAMDLIDMKPLPGVNFIKGDFTKEESYQTLLNLTKDEIIDWVISDMSPNMSGNHSIDQAQSMYLVELSLHFAEKTLIKGGNFLSKMFQGEEFDIIVKKIRKYFKKVTIRKPKASRLRSRELYIIGFHKKN